MVDPKGQKPKEQREIQKAPEKSEEQLAQEKLARDKARVLEKYDDDEKIKWEAQNQKILNDIEGKQLSNSFTECLHDYCNEKGKKIENAGTLSENFRRAKAVAGVPDDEIGNNTFLNDVLDIAKKHGRSHEEFRKIFARHNPFFQNKND